MTLPTRDAYRLWAPHYTDETAVTILEDRLVGRLTPSLTNRTLLDAACGTGRRLPGDGACRLALGVDLVPEMLRAARHPAGRLVVGDLSALPLPNQSFDVVWCRLALGHVPDLEPAYAELARVLRADGTLVVTDFHPAAAAAGHRRTFRDGARTLHELEHHVHAPEHHVGVAHATGLAIVERVDAAVGPELRPVYERADRLVWYERDRGLPLVLALRFQR